MINGVAVRVNFSKFYGSIKVSTLALMNTVAEGSKRGRRPHSNLRVGKLKKTVWILFALTVTLPILYVYLVRIDLFGLFGGMPNYAAVENPKNDLSSELISSDGVSLGRYFLYMSNRSHADYEELSPFLIKALVLSEDHRFYEHAGMDFLAYPRVLWGILTFRNAGGGSTITQQLAKNLYTLDPELDGKFATLSPLVRRVIQKTKEWIISIHLERNFTKEEIITMYLNTSFFGSNAWGIKVASQTYFNKPPSRLSVQESAVLVGLLQNPTVFNPFSRPDNALRKRNQVLYKLHKHGYVRSIQAFDSLKASPIVLDYNVENQNDGLAPYFRTVIRPRLLEWCRNNGYNLYESGLKIYTTIDSKLQEKAEKAMVQRMASLQTDFDKQWNLRGREPWVDEGGYEIEGFVEKKMSRLPIYKQLVDRFQDHPDSIEIALNKKRRMKVFSWNGEIDTLFSYMDSLRYYNRFLQAGLVAMNPHTGEVKAWVGGTDHKYFKFDHVRQGARQPGSTFKPFIYGKAIEAGYSPCHRLYDLSPSIKLPNGTTWEVRNSEGDKGRGDLMTLRRGLALSKNTVSVQLIQLVLPENVVEFAHRMGITTALDPVPSLALGTSDVRLLDLVAAYSSFVSLGIYTAPHTITRIEDKNGNVIEAFIPQSRQVTDEGTAYKMVYMLRGGVEEPGGTSSAIHPFLKQDNEVGGKTGTTDKASDGWYVGITHDLVTGVWVGGDEPSIHFPSWVFGAGGKTARPIWEEFMLNIYQDPASPYRKGNFKHPSENLDMTLDCTRYENAISIQ